MRCAAVTLRWSLGGTFKFLSFSFLESLDVLAAGPAAIDAAWIGLARRLLEAGRHAPLRRRLLLGSCARLCGRILLFARIFRCHQYKILSSPILAAATRRRTNPKGSNHW
jgi:hypothetical protein